MSLGVTEASWPQEPTLLAGDFRSSKSVTVLSGEGELARGTVLARDEATDKLVALDKETVVAAAVLGAASKTLTAETAEVLGAASKTADSAVAEILVDDAGGSLKEFHAFFANVPVVPGSIDGDATVGAAAKTFTDSAENGKISGDSGNIQGFVDYASGHIFLKFATAPDDDTDVTADYDYGEDKKVFVDTIENTPVNAGSVTVNATIGAAVVPATDDGNGVISGTGVTGTINYGTGEITVTYTTAPDDPSNVTVNYTHGADTKTFAGTLANNPVIPRTVTVDATIGAAGVEATDDGHGVISGTGVSGTINYDTGAISVTYTTAPDDPSNVTVDYTYGDEENKHLPVGILVEDVDATSGDVTGQMHEVGEYRDVDLTWPASITAGNKARATEQLAAQGCIIK